MTAFSGIPVSEFKVNPPEGQIYYERPYIEALREAHPGIDVSYVQARGLTFLTELEDLFWLYGFPFLNPGFHPWLVAINRRAREAGTGTILTGLRGNYFLSRGGKHYLGELASTGHWWTLWKELEALSRHGKYPL